MKRWLCAALLFATYGCVSTAPPRQPEVPEPSTPTHGVASWYGQEFAGRTTANGEIFDPLLMTAAHRTLPFGTIVDVTNPKTSQTVRVRINDRGPYIGNRVIDLSYAAAQQIGLVEPGSGEVNLAVVRVGKGEREPPAPYNVTINGPTAAQPEAPKVETIAPAATTPAPIPVPAPAVATPAPAATPDQVPVIVDKVQVVEEHGGVETRRQVSASGKSVEVVPVTPRPAAPPQRTEATPPARETRSAPGHSTAEALDAATHRPAAPKPAPVSRTGRFVVQVGAFSIEANAKALQERLTKIGEQSWIDHTTLYHVRIGPFETREQAIKVRSRLESSGISAIVVTP